MADVLDLDKYREQARAPTSHEREIEYSRLSKREKRIYERAWITGALDESRWITTRLLWLLSMGPEELERYFAIADAYDGHLLGEGLPKAVREAMREFLTYQGPRLVGSAGCRQGPKRR